MMREAAMYCEQQLTRSDRFYVGQKGTMPRLGEQIKVINFFDGAVYLCCVVNTFPKTLEYTVSVIGKHQQLELWPEDTP